MRVPPRASDRGRAAGTGRRTRAGPPCSAASTGCCTATSGARTGPRRCGRCAARRCAGALEWIIARQEADGCWGGIQPPWVYSLIALRLLGYGLDHPVMRARPGRPGPVHHHRGHPGRAGAPDGGLPVAGLGHRARDDRARRRGPARRPSRARQGGRLDARRGDHRAGRLAGAQARAVTRRLGVRVRQRQLPRHRRHRRGRPRAAPGPAPRPGPGAEGRHRPRAGLDHRHGVGGRRLGRLRRRQHLADWSPSCRSATSAR